MKISNGIKVYCKSMGKIFRIQHIAKTDDEANEFMRKHPDTGVIAEDSNLGLIFIAEFYAVKVPATVLPD